MNDLGIGRSHRENGRRKNISSQLVSYLKAGSCGRELEHRHSYSYKEQSDNRPKHLTFALLEIYLEKPMIALADRLQTFAQGDLSSAFPECATEDEISYMIQVAKGMASDLDMIITDAGELLGQMAEGNYAIGTKIEDKYVGQFVALKDAMRKMNRQMNGTLHQVEEAAKQVSAGAENLAESAQSLAEIGRASCRERV